MSGRGLARRIRRLERRPGGAHGPCPLCRDVGYVALVDETKGQTGEGCPRCGKVSKLIVLGRSDGATVGEPGRELERARTSARPVCGQGGAGPVTYKVLVPEATATVPAAHAARPTTTCTNCGRPRAFWITLPQARGE